MARPRTKGDPINFRLSLAAHDVIEAKATFAGQSPSEWVAAAMEKWAAAQIANAEAALNRDVAPNFKGSRRGDGA